MAQEAVRIKGTRHGLVIHLAPQPRFEDLKNHLEAKIAAAGGFLAGANFSFQYGPGTLSPAQEAELAGLCRRYGLVPGERNQAATPRHAVREPRPEAYPEARFLHGILRSGQVAASHSHLVVLGDVHPGAELRAAGDILVFGVLAGSAHAGCNGNHQARVVAGKMERPHLAIAGIRAEGEVTCAGPGVAVVRDGQIVVERYVV